jgi:hypothetical protein
MLSDSRPQAKLGAKLDARRELRRWTAAREYWERAVAHLELARSAADPGIRSRYLRIAQYYRTAAEAEERAAFESADERLAERDDRRPC